MKTTIFSLAVLSLLEFVAAQPHGRHHHRALRARTVTVTAVSSTTAAPFGGKASKVPATPVSFAADPAFSGSVSSISSSGAVASASSTAGVVPSSGGFGVAYGPLSSDGVNCKSDSQILSEVQGLSEFSVLRVYDTTCLGGVFAAAKATGKTVFAGICNLADASAGAQKIADVFGADWSVIHTVAVGNEVVATGANSPGDVAGATKTTRDALRSKGYQGPVVSVDILWTVIAHPELCEYSDYVAVNAHAFFDSSASAETAGDFIKNNYQNLQSACGGKKVVVTESGWPSAGFSHGNAVPSKENQATAISGLKAAFSEDPSTLMLFSAFDEPWKQDNSGTYGAEKHWGMF